MFISLVWINREITEKLHCIFFNGFDAKSRARKFCLFDLKALCGGDSRNRRGFLFVMAGASLKLEHSKNPMCGGNLFKEKLQNLMNIIEHILLS